MDEGIGLEEAAQGRIVGPGGKEDQAVGRILALAGELLGDVSDPVVARRAAEGGVFVQLQELAGGIGDDRGRAEVIPVVEAQRAGGGLGGQALRAGEDVLGGGPIRGFLQALAEESRRLPIADLLDPAAIAVIDKLRPGREGGRCPGAGGWISGDTDLFCNTRFDSAEKGLCHWNFCHWNFSP